MIRPAMTHAGRRRLAVALAVGWILAGSAHAAHAHGQTSPIAADHIRIQTDAPPGDVAFEFMSTDSANFSAAHDPALDGASLLVRGVGANAGRTPLVVFDPALWSPTPNGYSYQDPAGARGGITSAEIANGQISISGTTGGWGFAPQGPQDEVWVHLRIEDEWYCAQFSLANASIQTNVAGHFEAVSALAPGSCPAQVCGNGVHELGESCDDGNLVDGDGCDSDCTIGLCNGTSFASTFEGIQKVIFESEAYGCSRGTCHDSVFPDAKLDLSHDHAYESLLGANGLGAPADQGAYLRVLPLEPNESLLYLKLASKKATYTGPDVGPAMPASLTGLSDEHLEAVRRWIRGGAPRDLVVEGTAALLGTCFPPADALKTPVPDAPATELGFQLRQTPYPLRGTSTSQGETELCMSTYYDLSDRAPQSARLPCPTQFEVVKGCSNAAKTVCTGDQDCSDGGTCIAVRNAMNPGNECVAYDRITVIQDPQSHHSILGNYIGKSGTDDTRWGEWTYKFEADDPNAVLNGQPCDPTQIDTALGYNPGCSSKPTESIACVGYGPGDLGNLNLLQGTGGNLPQISLSQETYYDFSYPPGVHNVMPIKGVIVWNSHAFNLSPVDSTLAQFLNIEYAPEQERVHASTLLFDAQWIFAQFVQPFEQKEVCATYTAPRGARLFQLSSHTHRHGKRWRTWGPPNTPCRPACPTAQDDSYLFLLKTLRVCNSDSALPLCTGPRDNDQPLYFSSDYSDPLNMEIDPPLELDSPNDADRTFLYCSVFDNGTSESAPPVKRASSSPQPPDVFQAGAFLEALGGPCRENLSCANEGPMKGQACANSMWEPVNEVCDSFNGAGDGDCDACPVHGGVTTEDEMLILLGNYYLTPEPGVAVLGAAALGALGALARRRSRSR